MNDELESGVYVKEEAEHKCCGCCAAPTEMNPEAVLLADIGDIEDIAKRITDVVKELNDEAKAGDETISGRLLGMVNELKETAKGMQEGMLEILAAYHKEIRELKK